MFSLPELGNKKAMPRGVWASPFFTTNVTAYLAASGAAGAASVFSAFCAL